MISIKIEYIRVFVFVAVIMGAAQVVAQVAETKSDDGYDKRFEEKIVAKVFVNPLPANNDQYFNSWTNGEILFTSGNVVKNEMFRYNCFLDELLWIRKTDYLVGLVYKNTVSEFTLYQKETNKKLLFRNMRMKNWLVNDSSSMFLQVLVEGKISLFVFRKAQKISSFNELVRKDEYFLYYNGEYHKFKPNRYNLYKILGDANKPKMKEAIRSQHLKVKYEPQLIKAIEIYNANEK